ncbi:hypothetical protein EOE18_12075 [Novosphingobium umbonatum]|uniref:Uncharacterized protein n=1 Tax=Novosphingobium umbonatum TaxID=1908524 RepID=A0A437N2S9_9SPHN|nr:hypothetical protein [Novosphingobium umbonatum]RVU04231.1 hypothetical protein EOE18_12075 [Novosphingobium umbonatum]
MIIRLIQPVFKSLALVLPALIPSWRFFDAVSASPRLDYVLLAKQTDDSADWRPFRPRPERLTFPAMLRRMLWNAERNESLFLVSCSERLVQNPTAHSQSEILRRIARHLAPQADATPFLQVRLRFVLPDEDGALNSHVAYLSPVLAVKDLL